MINRKNFVFKEEIEHINKEKASAQNALSIRKAHSLAGVTNFENSHESQAYNRKGTIPSTFNPFEISLNPDAPKMYKHSKINSIRSNSDIGIENGFLNRVESLSDTKNGRRSDIVHHIKPFSSTTKDLYIEFKRATQNKISNSKISHETYSNIETSSKNETSNMSGEVQIDEGSQNNLLLNLLSQGQTDLTPKFSDELYNPFFNCDFSHEIVEENDEEE